MSVCASTRRVGVDSRATPGSSRFGRDTKMKATKAKFVLAITQYADNPYVHQFGRLWGTYEPYDDPVKACDHYLYLLGVLLANLKGKQRQFSPGGLNVYVRATVLLLAC